MSTESVTPISPRYPSSSTPSIPVSLMNDAAEKVIKPVPMTEQEESDFMVKHLKDVTSLADEIKVWFSQSDPSSDELDKLKRTLHTLFVDSDVRRPSRKTFKQSFSLLLTLSFKVGCLTFVEKLISAGGGYLGNAIICRECVFEAMSRRDFSFFMDILMITDKPYTIVKFWKRLSKGASITDLDIAKCLSTPIYYHSPIELCYSFGFKSIIYNVLLNNTGKCIPISSICLQKVLRDAASTNDSAMVLAICRKFPHLQKKAMSIAIEFDCPRELLLNLVDLIKPATP